jgi:hypothetical protein
MSLQQLPMVRLLRLVMSRRSDVEDQEDGQVLREIQGDAAGKPRPALPWSGR